MIPTRIHLALSLLALPAVAQEGDAPPPEWIWSVPHPRGDQEGWFRTDFELRGEVVRAELFGSADNHMKVWLNGEQVAASDEWTRPVEREVAGELRAGANALCAWAKNDGGPAGLLLRLSIELEGGETVEVVTDDTWHAVQDAPPEGWTGVEHRPSGWKLAKSFGALGIQPWGALDGSAPASEPGPSESIEAARLELPDDFRAERLYSVPRESQGSWVSLCTAPKGRLYASDQYGGLYRVTPPPVEYGVTPPPIESAAETVVEEVPVDLGAAQGLLWAFGSLYVVVNGAAGYESGLYRVRDTDGDDVLDTVEQLRKFSGSGEHGPHAIRVGPDGDSLYIIFGNHVKLPDVDSSRVPRVWSEDLLLPRLPDPNGHANGKLAPGGFVLSTDRNGERWELFASGFRNPYDFDFDASGELFTFDADMEWDIGLPWYRPTRVCHVVSGADFGWRYGSGKWPDHWVDSLPAAVDIGLSSPTGVEHGKRAGWPGVWGSALYVADWSYGTVYAVHLDANGSSFEGTAEPFIHGEPFPVTDIAMAPGVMYVTVGGRRVQSGLYRITSMEPAHDRDQLQAQMKAFEGSEERAQRHALEAWHEPRAEGLPESVAEDLGHTDRFRAHAARTALEHQPPGRWADLVLGLESPSAAAQGLTALLRVAPEEYGARVQARLIELFADGPAPEDLVGLLRAQELCFIRAGEPTGETSAAVVAALDPLFPHDDSRISNDLCRLLLYLEAPSVVGKALVLLEEAVDQKDQILYAHMLRNAADGWTVDERKAWFRWINEAGQAFSGGHSFRRYLDSIREDAVATLTDYERGTLGDALVEGATADPGEAEVVLASFVRQWRMDELAPGLEQRVSDSPDLERGRLAFRKAECFECHRMGGEGGSTGPDLTRAVGRFSARDILEATLEPSLVISDQYQDTAVETSDGRFYVGRIEAEDEGWIDLRLGPPTEALIEIAKDRIVSREPYTLSRMPSGLANVLTGDEVDDLIAFILSGPAD